MTEQRTQRGPAVADIERAFEQVWELSGGQVPEADRVRDDQLTPAGDTAVRVLASVPATGASALPLTVRPS